MVSLHNNHIHDLDQIDIVMRIASIPSFWFAAPFLGWTNREMNALHKLWVKGLKSGYHLPKSTANVLISLPRSHGGVGFSNFSCYVRVSYPHTSCYVRRECIIVVKQMLEVQDSYSRIWIYRTKLTYVKGLSRHYADKDVNSCKITGKASVIA